MSGFWIRVNARLAADPSVRAFARVILPALPVWLAVAAACGLLETLWGKMIDDQEDGNLSHRDDDVLEEWANWRGDPGLFATAFRSSFTEDDGQVRDWLEYQGPLISRRERDRLRMRNKRRGAGGELFPDDVDGRGDTNAGPGDSAESSHDRPPYNGNGNEKRKDSSTSDDVERLLAGLSGTVTRLAWAAEINVAREGMHGTGAMTDAQIDQACRDYVGNGHLDGEPKLRHFRAFLKDATRTLEPTRSRSHRGTTGQRAPVYATSDNVDAERRLNRDLPDD